MDADDAQPIEEQMNNRQGYIFLTIMIIVNIAFSCLPLGYGFVTDDFLLVVDNPRIHSLDQFVKRIGEKYFHAPHYPYLTYWRPVSLFSFYLDYRIWGARPFGFHLSNALLHVLTAVVLFFLLLVLTRDRVGSMWLCLLYSVHPARADIVSWISGRTDLLSNLFILLALLCFFLWEKKDRRPMFLFAFLLCQAIALLAKEQAVMIPVALLFWSGWRYWHRTGALKGLLQELWGMRWPLAASAGLSLGFAWLHARLAASDGLLSRLGWRDVPLFVKTVGAYVRMLLLPFFPTHYVSIPMAEFYAGWWPYLLSFLILAALIIWLAVQWRRFPMSSQNLPFLVFMLPLCFISLIPSYPQLALRFASLGAIFAAAVFVDLARLLDKRLQVFVLCVLFVSWGGTFLLHQSGYRDNLAFYKRVVDNHPSELLSKRAYALELAKSRRYNEALRQCDEILAADNRSRVSIAPKTLVLKANLLLVLGRHQEAMTLADTALAKYRDDWTVRESHLVLAQVFQKLDQPEKELLHLQQACRIYAEEAHLARQIRLLLRLSRESEARQVLETALQKYPDSQSLRSLAVP